MYFIIIVFWFSVYPFMLLLVYNITGASKVALVVENPPVSAEDMRHGFKHWVGKTLSTKHGNPLQYSSMEKHMEEGPDMLQSLGSQRIGHDWSNLTCTHA